MATRVSHVTQKVMNHLMRSTTIKLPRSISQTIENKLNKIDAAPPKEKRNTITSKNTKTASGI
jgi:hypothetical protein